MSELFTEGYNQLTMFSGLNPLEAAPMLKIMAGSRVTRKPKKDNSQDARIGTVVEIKYETKAYIKWDMPTINTVTRAKQWHSTIDVKMLIIANGITAQNDERSVATATESE